MQGFGAAAGHRALSTGTLLIVAGGLALYQMTSLVLGPAGSRQLHLSLSVPAVDQDERNEWWTSGTNVSLGTLITASPAASAPAASTVTHRASSTVGTHPAAAPVAPVAPQLPAAPPVQDVKPAAHNGDDTSSGVHKGDNTD